MSNIFGGNTGLTYEQVKQRKAISDSLRAQNSARTPRNFGEGLHAISKALVARGSERQADARMKELDSEWKEQVGGMGLDPTRAAIFSRMPYEQRDTALLQWQNQQDAIKRQQAARGAASSRAAAKEAESARQRQAIASALMPQQAPREGVQMGPTMEAANAGAQSGGDLGLLQTEMQQPDPNRVLAQMLAGGVDPRTAMSVAGSYSDLIPKPEERKTAKDVNGLLRYMDTGEQVYEGVEKSDIGADRFKVVGNTLFDLAADGGPQAVGTGQGQTETIFGPDGNPIVQRGGTFSSEKLTEGAQKTNVYHTRAKGSLALLDDVGAEALTSRKDEVLDWVPIGLGRGLQTEDFQVAQQAGEEFLQAILRKDTGAAITEGEQTLYGKTYLPQPGDGPRVVEAKRASRIRAVEALQTGMSAQQVVTTERALIEAARKADETKDPSAPDPATGVIDGQGVSPPPPIQVTSSFGEMDANQLLDVDVMTLSPSEFDDYEKALRGLSE